MVETDAKGDPWHDVSFTLSPLSFHPSFSPSSQRSRIYGSVKEVNGLWRPTALYTRYNPFRITLPPCSLLVKVSLLEPYRLVHASTRH